MASLFRKALQEGLITASPPDFIKTNLQYEVIMGSYAYGCSGDTSDSDVYGMCIPPKDMIFPHLAGEIWGFGRQHKRFEQWQQHHVKDSNGNEYDFSIYGIVKYFNLLMDNNPNMIDSLFVPERCVIHITSVGELIRDNRKMFLHLGSWHKFRGYAHAQMHKIDIKTPEGLKELWDFEEDHSLRHDISLEMLRKEFNQRDTMDDLPPAVPELSSLSDENLEKYMTLFYQAGNRADIVKRFGYDVKFAYHVVRLMLQIEQIITTGDLNLERDSETYKSIRRGEWTLEHLKKWFTDKELELENVYNRKLAPVPYEPDERAIKKLLLECLEHHYGSLDKAIYNPDQYQMFFKEIESLVEKYKMK